MRKWKQLATEFVNSKRARLDKKTVDWYEQRLRHWINFIGKTKPKQVTVAHLDQYFGDLKTAGYAYSTRRGAVIALRKFFKFLRKQRCIKTNPFDEFDPLPQEHDSVAEPIPLTYAYQMIRAAESDPTPYGVRDAAIMRMLLTTGARREEIATLQMEQLDWEIGKVLLIGKFNRKRWVPLRATTISALRRWLKHRPLTKSQAVFVSLHPNKRQMYADLRPDAINDICIKWRDSAGLPKVSVSPHKWRHRFASEVKKAGDPFSLQMLLGHSDISTTQRYTHSSPEELAALVLRWGPDMPG